MDTALWAGSLSWASLPGSIVRADGIDIGLEQVSQADPATGAPF